MTAQVAEKLRYRGETLRLCAEPLEPYLESAKIRYSYSRMSTACWRGYQGIWEIYQDRLYLIKIDAEIISASGSRPANLTDYFPDAGKRVFAHWYSGTLMCTRGKLLRYVHGGFASNFEEEIYLKIKRGELVYESRIVNTENSIETND